MFAHSGVNLPETFTTYIETHFYGQITEKSKLESIVNDQTFLADPLKHVALYSDHGIVHGRDIANKIVQVLHQINGLLIPQRQGTRLDFMLGYGVVLAYLHDIGMYDFSAFGRAMHPEFAAQLVYTTEFDPLVELLWQENSGNIAWRLTNLAANGSFEQPPKQVWREMMTLAIAHSKSKIPIDLLNDRQQLRAVMQERLGSDLHSLYHQQRVQKAERTLATTQDLALVDRLKQQLEAAQAARSTWLQQANHQTDNPELHRYYQHFTQESFRWLAATDPELEPLVLDVIDTVRALRCADALRQRGQTFRTSAGYEVFVNQDTANAVYRLQTSDGSKQFLLEGKDPIAAGEANITSCDFDGEGNFRVSFDRGSFSDPAAVEWAVHSAAIVINDIQADVIGSFVRSGDAADAALVAKPADQMQILVEDVDDNPEFAAAVCVELQRLNSQLADRCRPVTSLQNADLAEVRRYLAGVTPTWSLEQQQTMLEQVARSGQKVEHLVLPDALGDSKLVSIRTGEVLFEANSVGSFVYLPMTEGLVSLPLGGYQPTPIQAWTPIGDTAVIKGSVRNNRVIAETETRLLMLPKQVYLQFWYNPYTVDEFVQLFGSDRGSTLERRYLLPVGAVHKKLMGRVRRSRYLPLPLYLKTLFKEADQVPLFMSYLEKRKLLVDETLFRQGEAANQIYFVEIGQVGLVSEGIKGQDESEAPIEAGAILGEIDFYTQTHYQVTAIARGGCQLYCLTREALQRMKQEYPQVALAFSDMLLSLVAKHLMEVTQRE